MRGLVQPSGFSRPLIAATSVDLTVGRAEGLRAAMQVAVPFLAASSVVLFVRSWRASIERKKRMEAMLEEVRQKHRHSGRPAAAAATRHSCRHLTASVCPARLLQYRELFNTPVERLHALRDALVEQMEAGLAGKVRTSQPSRLTINSTILRHNLQPLLAQQWHLSAIPYSPCAGERPHDAALVRGCAAQRAGARRLLRHRPGGHQPAGGAGQLGWVTGCCRDGASSPLINQWTRAKGFSDSGLRAHGFCTAVDTVGAPLAAGGSRGAE